MQGSPGAEMLGGGRGVLRGASWGHTEEHFRWTDGAALGLSPSLQGLEGELGPAPPSPSFGAAAWLPYHLEVQTPGCFSKGF